MATDHPGCSRRQHRHRDARPGQRNCHRGRFSRWRDQDPCRQSGARGHGIPLEDDKQVIATANIRGVLDGWASDLRRVVPGDAANKGCLPIGINGERLIEGRRVRKQSGENPNAGFDGGWQQGASMPVTGFPPGSDPCPAPSTAKKITACPARPGHLPERPRPAHVRGAARATAAKPWCRCGAGHEEFGATVNGTTTRTCSLLPRTVSTSRSSRTAK